MHTWDALLIGRVPIDILISIEDCCLISFGAKGVSQVLNYREGALTELYSIQLLLINPKDCSS